MKNLIILLTAASGLMAAVTFTTPPSISRVSPTEWTLSFSVSEYTDVAVSIVNIADSTVIRHLVAGKLGGAAPAPLLRNALSQTLAWDGRNDRGQEVSVPDNQIRARVRAGINLQLISLVGDNPYAFLETGIMKGVVTGPDGSAYVCGMPAYLHHEHYSTDYVTVRKYDRDGNYVKTLFPFPANLTAEEVSGWGTIIRDDGKISPKCPNVSLPNMTNTIMGHNKSPNGAVLQMLDNGKLVFGSYRFLSFGTDGSLSGSAAAEPAITSPALPKTSNLSGIASVTPVPGTPHFYFCGLFNVSGSTAPDTNFYRDGRIFKVNRTTGTAEIWLALDSAPQTKIDRAQKLGGGFNGFATFQSTAVDSSGRVYVCDRLNNRIGIYDGNANLLRSIPLKYPDRAVISSEGVLYAVARFQQTSATGTQSATGFVRLYKYTPYEQGSEPVCSVIVATAVYGASDGTGTGLAVSNATAQPSIWVAAPRATVHLYRDAGTSFILSRDFLAESGGTNQNVDRLAVDRNTEVLYVQDAWYTMMKIEDWSNPVMRVCSTTAGKKLGATDMTVSPDGYLYVREAKSSGKFDGPVTRYTQGRRHAPANFANTGSNMVTPHIKSRFAPCTGERGLAVAPDGRVAVMGRGYAADGEGYHVGIYGDSGSADTSLGRIQIYPLPIQCGGVKYDLAGNLYIGAFYRPAEYTVPAWYTTDTGYTRSTGSVIRFRGDDSGSVVNTNIKDAGAGALYNADKVYAAAVGPFSKDPYGGCVCRSPRFEVDPYGRILMPNGVESRITLLDNEGNQIAQFGEYGNLDSRGSLAGPGEVIAGSGVPLAFPTAVAASEDYLYVSDQINCRIVRVKMVYDADNYPGLTEKTGNEEKSGLWRAPLFGLSSGPLPFSGMTTVSVTVPEHCLGTLKVFDMRGRLVKTLLQGAFRPGITRAAWNGRAADDRPLASGPYLYRLTAGTRVLMKKTILAR